MSENKASRRAAIRHVSERDGVSYAVASAKLDGMGKKSRKRLYRHLGLRWSTPRKPKPPITPQETTSGTRPTRSAPIPNYVSEGAMQALQDLHPGVEW